MDKRVGDYSFIVGVLIAVILGLAAPQLGPATTWLVSILVLLGLVVGFLNVTGKDTKDFLIVGAILAVVLYVSSGSIGLGDINIIGPYIDGIVKYAMAFIVPAIIVVCLKEIWALGQQK
jgi:hypothetical protein